MGSEPQHTGPAGVRGKCPKRFLLATKPSTMAKDWRGRLPFQGYLLECARDRGSSETAAGCSALRQALYKGGVRERVTSRGRGRGPLPSSGPPSGRLHAVAGGLRAQGVPVTASGLGGPRALPPALSRGPADCQAAAPGPRGRFRCLCLRSASVAGASLKASLFARARAAPASPFLGFSPVSSFDLSVELSGVLQQGERGQVPGS